MYVYLGAEVHPRGHVHRLQVFAGWNLPFVHSPSFIVHVVHIVHRPPFTVHVVHRSSCISCISSTVHVVHIVHRSYRPPSIVHDVHRSCRLYRSPSFRSSASPTRPSGRQRGEGKGRGRTYPVRCVVTILFSGLYI